MMAPSGRQRELIELYVREHPHLAEIAERAKSEGDYKTLGDAMAAVPYPPGVSGPDALEIGKIGLRA